MLKVLLNRLIDKLQATFPPNRIVVLLTPVAFVPASAAVTAWVAAHFPGLALPEGVVAGLAGGAALAALTLAYKWLDQWQHGENIATQADVEQALSEFADSPDVQDLFHVLGSLEGVGAQLGELRVKVDSNAVTHEEITAALGAIGDAIGGVLHEYPVEPPPAINAAAEPAE